MDFSWDEKALARKADVIRFAQAELGGGVAEADRNCDFPRENWDKCARYGIHGLAVPTQYGGGGLDIATTVLVMEGLGYGCPDTGLTYAINSQMWSLQPSILHFGTEEQKHRYLPALVGGTCGAFAITEAEAGSDPYSLQATAARTDDGYVLNGVKKFITLAPHAEVALVFATVDPALGRWGVTGFLVERGNEGFSTTATQPKMGLRTTPIGDITLADCHVPESSRLGSEGSGVSIFNTAMQYERGYVYASQLGAMERQLEQAIEWARTRRQSGQPIGKFQSVAHRIADMKLRLELGRLLLYKVAWLETHGEPPVLEAALANLWLSEIAVDSALDAVRNRGARGYLTEYDTERDLRDAIGGLIYSGTSDIQRTVIARLLGL